MVSEGAPDGGFTVRIDSEVEVLRGRCGVTHGGGAVDSFLVDDGDSPASLVGAVAMVDLVS